MKFPSYKLNQKGFSHVAILLVAIVVSATAFVGYRVVGSSSAATASSVCGSGYKAVKHIDIKSKSNSQTIGRLNVLRNNKSYCAVLMSHGQADGVAKTMYIALGEGNNSICNNAASGVLNGGIGASPSKPVVDSGKFKHYAGPVKKSVKCAYAWSRMAFQGTTYYAWITTNR